MHVAGEHYAHEWKYPWEPEEGVESPGTGVTIPWLWVTQLVLIGEPESPERAANAFNWWICNLFTIFSWSDIMMPLACVCEEFFVLPPQDHWIFKEHFYILRISSMYTMCSDHVQPSFLAPNSPRHLHRAPAPTSTAPFVLNPTTPHLVLFART